MSTKLTPKRTTFILECWHPAHAHYRQVGKYATAERAQIMFNKSYFSRHARRLIQITEEVICKAAGERTAPKEIPQ